MQSLGGAAIPMQQKSDVSYVVGDAAVENAMPFLAALPVFSQAALDFLMAFSKRLLEDKEAKTYPDVTALGFWCRKASLCQMMKPYGKLRRLLGRGIVFHIAPSNVAVNFAYSCIAALLAGNASIVRLPSKAFPQVDIICRILCEILQVLPELRLYFLFVRYGHTEEVHRIYSAMCDTRIIWGGDQTIAVLRAAPLSPRANEITFADRRSLAIIQADHYLHQDERSHARIAQDFYNDTYLTDQNACTSPRLVIWMGNNRKEARTRFWRVLHALVRKKYDIQPIQTIDKYTALLRLSALHEVKLIPMPDHLIMRAEAAQISSDLMDDTMNSGFFVEYEADSFEELLPLCTNRCQTISCCGVDISALAEFIVQHGTRGVDRIVSLGHSMDFSLTWDGVDLIRTMSRQVYAEG